MRNNDAKVQRLRLCDTSSKSSPAQRVDGADEPILPVTADDVVSIGEFIDVGYFEPYQELRDSLFVGELIQVAP